MTPATIIADARADGILLAVGSDGSLAYRGPRRATEKWLPILRGAKPAILAHLRGSEGVADSGTTAPCPADVTERAAVIADGCGCPADVAAAQALGEHGFASWKALGAAKAAEIKLELSRLSPPSNRRGARLLTTTRNFIASPWLARSAAAGWSLVELFGISAVAPSARLDQQGLVTGLALSALPRLRLVAIEPDHARLVGRSESPLTYRRFTLDTHAATLWWKCRVIVGEPHAA